MWTSFGIFVIVAIACVSAINQSPTNKIMATSSPPSCEDGSVAPQPFLWNVLYHGADGTNFHQTPGVATMPVATAYSGGQWTTTGHFGIWPTVTGDPPHYYVNSGGVPQAIDMTKLVSTLKSDIEGNIPDPDYSGVIGFDFEGWQPIWDGFLFGGYRNVSIELVMKQHPTWNTTQVETEAEKQFNAAAKLYFLTVLKTAQDMRPKAKWGFYGTPFKGWHSYWSHEYAPAQRQHNDNLAWLWDAVDVIMPELYFHGTGPSANYVRSIMEEAERLANNTVKGHKPIVPYTWARPGNWKSFLTLEELEGEMLVPFEYKNTEAVLVWGNSLGHTPEYQAYYNSTFGPMIEKFTKKQCDCAKTKCSGNGRCVVNNTACFCNAGWSGDDCSKSLEEEKSTQTSSSLDLRVEANVVCPDGISACPSNHTCAQLSTGYWGCCPLPQAVVCNFHSCCPSGTKCGANNDCTA